MSNNLFDPRYEKRIIPRTYYKATASNGAVALRGGIGKQVFDQRGRLVGARILQAEHLHLGHVLDRHAVQFAGKVLV